MADLKKFPVKLAVEQEDGKFYVYGSHITNFNEVIEKIEQTNSLLETSNTLLVDANGHLTDINGNLIEIDGELVSLNTVEGTVTDAAVTGDNDGTISAKLRGLTTQTVQLLSKNDDIIGKIEETNTLLQTNNALLVDANGHLVDVNGNLVEIDGELVSVNTVDGLTTDTAVTGDNPGTISAKLRGLTTQTVQLLAKNDTIIDRIEETNSLLTTNNSLLVDANGHLVDVNGNLVEIDGDVVSINTVEGLVNDAAVTGDNDGTISAKLRGLSTQMVSLLTNTSTNSTAANQTNGTQQTKVTDGTNVVNVLKSDGTKAGNNAQMIAGSFLEVPFTTSTVQAVGTTDVANYNWVSVHVVTKDATASIAFQGSNDGVNWVNGVGLQNAVSLSGSGTAGSGPAAGTIYHGPINYRYFRLNVTGISAGVAAGVIEFSTIPKAMQAISASITGSVNLAAATTGGYSYTHIAAGQATSVIKASAGTLHSITFNGAATATNVTTLYDNATGVGTVIGIPAVTAVTAPQTVVYDLAFTAGLTIITSIANGADMTVTYK